MRLLQPESASAPSVHQPELQRSPFSLRPVFGIQLLIDIPVVFLTGSTDTGTVVAAKKLGAVGYVVKPFIPQELVEKVKAILKL